MSQGQISQRLRPFKPQPFGRYTLLLPLSTGGMGEIYLAQLSGSHGFDKLCVIKKILPHLAEDDDFVSRFVDEARILVKLHHGNVAQVLDMGVHEGAPYIALEFVDGKDLRRVLMRMRERNLSLPLSFVLSVMSRVLDALAYAHRKRGDDDAELNLVHRDVSPQNVLISYEGEVKVIDFGLAKSALSLAKTSPSIVLGKFMYMSPEQARHKGVDRRSDLYAVGLCLWELIAGRNPFEDVPSGELMAKVANPEVQPLAQIDPLCPGALSDAVARALNPDPAQRFQTAEEFRGRLQAILQDIDPQAGAESTSRFMREVFAPEYAAERKMLATVRDQARALQPDDEDEPVVPRPASPTVEAALVIPPVMDDETPAASRINALNPEALSFSPTRKASSPNLGKPVRDEIFEKETMPAIVVRIGDEGEPPLVVPAPQAAAPVRARVLSKSFDDDNTEAATPAMAEPQPLPSIMVDGLPSEPVHTELEVPAAFESAAPRPLARNAKKAPVRKPATAVKAAVPRAPVEKPEKLEKKSARLPPVQRTDTMIVRNPLPAETPSAPALPPRKKGGGTWAWFVIPLVALLAVGGYIAWDQYADELRALISPPAPLPEVPQPVVKKAPAPLPVEAPPAVEPEKEEVPQKAEPVKKVEAPVKKVAVSPGAAALKSLESDFGRIVDESKQRKFRLQLTALQGDVDEKGEDAAYVARVQSLHAQVKAVLESQE